MPITDRLSIAFQRNFREYWLEKNKAGSFTRVMIPDITFTSQPKIGSNNLLVLDSKYRINNNLNEALSSIHMYRDALVQDGDKGVKGVVVGAYLISPYMPNLKNPWKKVKTPGRFFHPEYRGEFKFGAVTMRPGMSVDDVKHLLESLLEDLEKGAA